MYLMSLVLFATLTIFVGTSAGAVIGRIVGGQNANITNHPYQVFVERRGSGFCGGSIIDVTVVLTAAHCLRNKSPNIYRIQYGVTIIGGSQNWIQVKRVIAHKEFTQETGDYDIGLLILKTEIPLGPTAQIIPLATETPAPCTEVVVTGWGTTHPINWNLRSEHLQSVTLLVYGLDVCKQQYREFTQRITERNLCVGVLEGGKDACKGDSGGPVVARGKLVGIVSWSYNCALKNHMNVHTNVASMRNWIIENKSKKFKCIPGLC